MRAYRDCISNFKNLNIGSIGVMDVDSEFEKKCKKNKMRSRSPTARTRFSPVFAPGA